MTQADQGTLIPNEAPVTSSYPGSLLELRRWSSVTQAWVSPGQERAASVSKRRCSPTLDVRSCLPGTPVLFLTAALARGRKWKCLA